jgi:hypothetical protein
VALIPGNLLDEENQSIETGLGLWGGDTTSSSSTVRSTAQAHDGTASIAATYNGTANNAMAGIVSSAPAVVVGTEYTFSAWVRPPRTATMNLLIEWYNGSNTYISDTGFIGSTSCPANTWTQLSGTGTAPASAATARIYLMSGTSLSNGDVVYWDEIFFGVPMTSPMTFIASGTWTAPEDVNYVQVECWAGGGAGGAGTGNPAEGGGGAGGSYARAVAYPVTPGITYTVTVGAATSTATGNGATGNDSWFDSSSGVLAKGGAGGTAATTNSSNGTGGTGSTTGCIGDVVYAGGNGANGVFSSSNAGGAGGGGAGDSGPGGNASGGTAGAGGTSGGGSGASGVGDSQAGAAGTAPGGGGSGGDANSTTNRNGGAGARGQVILTWPAAPPFAGKAANIVSTTAVRRASTW